MFKKKSQRKPLVVESYSCIKSLYKKSKIKHLTKQNIEKNKINKKQTYSFL